MSTVPNDIITQLKNILDARDEHGFVDLRSIHVLVAPVDQRETIQLLSPKKIADVRARLTTTDFDPVRLDNGRVFVFYELAYEVIIHRRADLKHIVLEWKGERGDAVQQIVSAVPELATRVQEVFGDNGIRHTRIDGKFYFAASDMAKLVLWDEETQTPIQSHLNEYIRRAAQKDVVLSLALIKHTHQFRGGYPSSILDINDTARLWVNLPGAKATAFRTQIIRNWIRVFGGDLSLIDEIRQNNEIQRSLPDSHPARAFGDEVEASGVNNANIVVNIDRFKEFEERTQKAFDAINASIAAGRDRVDSLMVDVHNDGVDLMCQYKHLVRSIDNVSTEGVSDYNFRAEFNGFCITLANVFFHTLEEKSSVATAEFIRDVLNVTIIFARPITRWSSLCTRTLLQGCAVLRIRRWTCKERGLEYPNAAVTKEIQHSTYLNVRSYFSLISHIDRVWEERGYDGCVVLGNMISALMAKFGADLTVYDIDEPIEYHYGARRASENVAVPVAPAAPAHTDAPFERFLWHFFALDHVSKTITVTGLIRLQREFAVANGLPEITSRQKILQNVSNFSRRLQPVKTGNKITGWTWR